MHTTCEPIAIVGSSCRFPGGVDCPQKLWELLENPRDVVKKIPNDRFAVEGFLHEDGNHHGATNVAYSYFLDEDPRTFDAGFFQISPREAESIDPQHRLLLESVYEALESAGMTLESTRGTAMGVYVGLMSADYYDILAHDNESAPQYLATGTARSILSNRISYFFDWKGPSITVDTACSSSLVAVHQAVQALRNGECTAAVAAGTNLIFGPGMYIAESKLRMLSPTGGSRMWDANADGYTRGEGIGVVVLKRLCDAIRDGDHIECVIRETGVNSDGHTTGITVPSASSQAELIRKTYRRAGLDPAKESERCQYFEAHGTGTPTGDPIEAEAIDSVFFPENQERRGNERELLFVGSIKTVIGHTEGTAGIAGLLKASLALQNQTIPANLHFHQLNPKINPFYEGLHIVTESRPWPVTLNPRASVNSFGFGGTNAHCILERFEQNSSSLSEHVYDQSNDSGKPIFILPFSAVSQPSLASLLKKYHTFLLSNSDVDLHSLSYTLQQKRSIFANRTSVMGSSHTELIEQIQKEMHTTEGSHSTDTSLPQYATSGRILGIFTGQGAQWPTMGRELILKSKLFSSTIDRLDNCLKQAPDPPSWSLRRELLADREASRCHQASFSQPMCTAVQIALVDLLNSIGVSFSVVVGHSSGEIAAAYASGCLTADAAIQIAYYRGFHSDLARHPGGDELSMMAVGIGFEQAQMICNRKEWSQRLFVAANNGPSSITLAGELAALKELSKELSNDDIFTRILHIDKAYHTPYMAPCAAAYLDSLQHCGLEYVSANPSCTWISSVHGFEMDLSSDQVDNEYWVENLMSPVLFTEAIEQAINDHGPFDSVLEIGPHPALRGPTLQILKALGLSSPSYHGTLNRNKDDTIALGGSLASMWRMMPFAVSLPQLQEALNHITLPKPHVLKNLPVYGWDHGTPYWRESRLWKEYRNRPPPHELLGSLIGRTEYEIRWRNILKPQELPWLKGHRFQNDILFPAAGYCMMALEAARNIWSDSIKLIELQDIDIRQGISFEDDSSGVEVIFCLTGIKAIGDVAEGTGCTVANFSCSASQVDGAQPLTTRCTGDLRVKLTRSSASSLPARSQSPRKEMHSVGLDSFYESMARIGLEFTGCFRRLLNAERTMYQSSASASPFPGTLSVQTGFLDSCFHTLFMAMPVPGDGLHTAFLPRKIRSLKFNPEFWINSLFDSTPFQLDGYVTDFQPPSQIKSSSISGDVDVFGIDGGSFIQIEDLKCVALATASKHEDRRFFNTTVWDRHVSCGMTVCSNLDFETNEIATLHHKSETLASQYYEAFEDCIALQDSSFSAPSSIAIGTFGASASETSIEKRFTQAAGYCLLSSATGVNYQESASLMLRTQKEYLRDGTAIACIRRYTVRTVNQIAHENPHIKILEIGGGEGDTTQAILQGLDGAFTSYLFSDPSADAVGIARTRLQQASKRLNFITMDVRYDDHSKDLPPQSFDLVIASNISCEALEAIDSFENIHRLLKTGGLLLLIGPTGQTEFAKLIRMGFQGSVQGPRREPQSFVYSEDDRRLQLMNSCFSGIQSIVYDSGNSVDHCFSLILTQALDLSLISDVISRPLSTSRRVTLEDQILIIGGRSVLGCNIISDIQNHLGHWRDRMTVIESFDDILSTVKIPRFVFNIAELDEPVMKDISPERFQVLQHLFQQAQNILWITAGYKQGDVFSSMSVGLGRVLTNEMSSLTLNFLDISKTERLDPKRISFLLAQFVIGIQNGLLQDPSLWLREQELAIEDNFLMVPRVLPQKQMNDRYNSSFRAITKTDDSFPSVSLMGGNSSWFETPNGSQPKEMPLIAVSVDACSTDALLIFEATYLYMCLGRVEGDPAKPVLCFSSSKDQLIRVPSNWLHEWSVDWGCDASQMLNALIGLHISSQIRASLGSSVGKGTIVVHTEDSQLAHLVDYSMRSHRIPIKILTSNPLITTSIESSITPLHANAPLRGVRIALPQDTSSFIDMSLDPTSSLLAHILRALPDGCDSMSSLKRYLHQDASGISLGADISSIQSCLDSLYREILDAKSFLTSLCRDVKPMHFKDLIRVESYSNSDNTKEASLVQRLNYKALFYSHSTYLLIGMTSDLGRSLCEWMFENGARNIVIASRSPRSTAQWYDEIRRAGCQLMVESIDICDKYSLDKAYRHITESMPPIAGVVNAAMVLSDSAFLNMAYEDFVRCLAPKMQGSMNLHDIFSSSPLDFFIMFSSTSTLIGNPGQANYAVANMFMRALAETRRSKGLAGSCIDIGMIVGIGYVARHATYENHLRQQGMMAVSETDFHCMFAEAICAGQPGSTLESSCISIGLNVATGKQKPLWYHNPRFAHFQVLDHDAENEGGKSALRKSSNSIKARLQKIKDEGMGYAIIQEEFVSMLRGLLQMRREISDFNKPIVELGLDSLIAVQVRTWFSNELGFQVSVLKILGGASITSLCHESAASFFGTAISEPQMIASARSDPETTATTISSASSSDTSLTDTAPSEPATDTKKLVKKEIKLPTPDPLVEKIERMSVEQDRIWFLLQCVDDPTMYNCTVQFEIKGVLEKNQLKNAVTLVAKRHESLRTAFSVDYSLDGCTPQQLILKEPQLCWTWFNVNEMADVQSEFDKLHSRVYDLKKGQTMAITLLSHSANHHTVIFGYHHLILDGFSWQFVLQEFAATFRHQSSLLSPSSSVVQYADFSRHQWAAFDDPTNAADKAYWALKLAEIPDPLPLFPCSKMDIRKPAHTVTRYTMIRRDNTFDGETTRLVKQSSSSLGATSFHFHLAAIQVFIQKLLQVDRFCIGVANANRHDVAFSNVVGMMVEVLPMIFNPDKHNPFANLITATRDNVLDTLKRSTGPPFHVALTSPSADQFQVVVNYTVGAPHDIVFNDHCVFHYQTSEEASHAQDLVITIRDNDGDDGSTFISFAAQDYLYEPVDIEALTVAYARLIQAASQDQSCLLSEYQFLQTSAAGEVSFHNPVATSIAASGLDGLPQRIAQVSRQEPDLIAIKEYQEGTVLTYDAMEKRIQGVAALLIDAGIQAGMFVVVACGSHADSVCAFLAIWRIGAVYVPVDLDHGIERVKVVVKDCQPAAILCRQRDELNYMAELVDTIQILDLTFDLPSSIIPLCETFSELCQDSPVVLLYTSGTTGVPKGVLLSNGNLKAHIQAMEQFMDLGRQVILQQSSLSFDASLFQILNALVYGGTCIMATGRRNPMELAEIIVREMITVTLAVPSEYALWLGETNVAKVLSKSTAWRYAFCGGEKMTCATTQAFTRLGLLDLELINAYGPSETSIACSMERVAYRYIGNSTDQPIPIGKPLPSYTVEILDNHLQPVPHGWSGEICIGGPGVSLGYFNRDGETRSQFIDWPTGDTGTAPVRLYRSSDYGRYMADGRLVYQGRLAGDSQVKLRGIRLELDEVSDAIVQCSQGAVANAAVVAKGDEGANTFLVGFVVLSTDHYPIITDVQSFLKILLSTLPVPVYAKPAFLLPIDRIPLMPSGKVDRRLLANKISNAGPLRRSDTTSLNLIERKLSELWEEMLPRLDVQITKESNFFNLGGNSQLMLKLHQQIYQVTSVDIPVFRLFQASTLEDMAIAIGLTSSKVHMMSKNNINWDAETGIPDTLQRHRHQPDQQQAKPQRTQRGLEVILTGATGFLGTALLEHLNQNPLVEKIHCIAVRNLDAETPPRQLSIQSPKIVVYSGNLSHPTLGLTPTEISHLTNAASCMIHNGAEISFLKSYDDLRAANVSSTKFLMQLSADSARGGIPFHYISTAAVTGHSSRETFGEESVASFQPPSSTTAAHGYVSSKWASEVFLERASAQFGIPVFIHRPSSIVGPSRPSDDVIGNVIDISRRISTIPDLRSSGWKGYFDMISVDRVAREVVNKAIESHDHRIEGFLSFIHHCGETRFKVSELMAYLEKSAPDGAVFTQVDTKHWVERARMHGLSEGVAVYLDELEKLEDDKKWLLPLLD